MAEQADQPLPVAAAVNEVGPHTPHPPPPPNTHTQME